MRQYSQSSCAFTAELTCIGLALHKLVDEHKLSYNTGLTWMKLQLGCRWVNLDGLRRGLCRLPKEEPASTRTFIMAGALRYQTAIGYTLILHSAGACVLAQRLLPLCS